MEKIRGYLAISSLLIINLVCLGVLYCSVSSIKENYVIALIGFAGSILGGGLTLIGVWWTLIHNQKKEGKDEYIKAEYIFTEILPYLIKVYNEVKSLNPKNFGEGLEKVSSASIELEEKAKRLSELAIAVSIDFFREIKSIQYYSGVIHDYISNINPGKTDQEIYQDIWGFYQGLAKSDSAILNYKAKIKK